MIWTSGLRLLIARAAPAMSPPPPTGIIQASRSGTCSMISSPIVPCPARMWGWSYLSKHENHIATLHNTINTAKHQSPSPWPTGIIQASRSGTCSIISKPIVPCPARMWGWSYLSKHENHIATLHNTINTAKHQSPSPWPTGIIQASRSGTCSMISKPIVPCPARMWGWSYLSKHENHIATLHNTINTAKHQSPSPWPTGIIQASRSGTCSMISKPIVPCPARMWGWSYLSKHVKHIAKLHNINSKLKLSASEPV